MTKRFKYEKLQRKILEIIIQINFPMKFCLKHEHDCIIYLGWSLEMSLSKSAKLFCLHAYEFPRLTLPWTRKKNLSKVYNFIF